MKLDKNGYGVSLAPVGYCLICRKRSDLIRHEVYHGANRAKSKKYGLWCNLCTNCHYLVHNGHEGFDRQLKEHFQTLAMSAYGWDKIDFIREIGKNYLED